MFFATEAAAEGFNRSGQIAGVVTEGLQGQHGVEFRRRLGQLGRIPDAESGLP